MTPFHRRMIPVAALCVAPLLPAHADGPDPARAAPGAPLRYRSAFDGYKPFEDSKPGDWRSLNDALRGGGRSGRAGMQRGSGVPGPAMPISMPEAPSGPGPGRTRTPAAAASMPGMSGHAGHGMQGGKP